MKKLLMALCVILSLLLAGCGAMENAIPDDTNMPTEAPAAQEKPVEATEVPAAQENPAEAKEPADEQCYLIVTVAGMVYEPIPMVEPGRYTVRRGDHVNVIEVTADSVKMAESSCENQDCIYQGTVTLENKSQRVLQNMILCLPNEVILEMYTYDELKIALPDWVEGQE